MSLFLMISYQNQVYIECSMNLMFLVIEISWKFKKIEENRRNLFSSEISFAKSNFFDSVQFSLILVDFLWFWLIFFDFGWISLILFNFQCNKIDCKHLYIWNFSKANNWYLKVVIWKRDPRGIFFKTKYFHD